MVEFFIRKGVLKMHIWQDEANSERQRIIRSVTRKGKVNRVWIAIAIILGFYVVLLLIGLLHSGG